VSGPAALILALALLAVTLAVAVLRPQGLPEAAVAFAGAVILVAVGAIGASGAVDALRSLGPTVGFLAALLLIAEGCRREGLFSAIGDLMARRSGSSERRLLALVFGVASVVTIVLGLDATVVLLPPIVLATVRRLRTNPRAPLYACGHLANSASLLLPVSNLTNLLAFHASGLSFTRFALLMALPTLGAVTVEWLVISRFFSVGAKMQPPADLDPGEPLPRGALAVLAVILLGFAVSSPLGIAPVWVAVAGAVAMNLRALLRGRAGLLGLLRAAEPGFLIFVLGLGVIVAAASRHGLGTGVRDLLPTGSSLGDLLAVAVIAALLANLVNNLPATLILAPVAAAMGAGPVLAVLIGVNVGPNLTPVGSLATLLWRRVLGAAGIRVPAREFLCLGALTVPLALLTATALLWLGVTLGA
jgi:arsenical pump membrane protein